MTVNEYRERRAKLVAQMEQAWQELHSLSNEDYATRAHAFRTTTNKYDRFMAEVPIEVLRAAELPFG